MLKRRVLERDDIRKGEGIKGERRKGRESRRIEDKERNINCTWKIKN